MTTVALFGGSFNPPHIGHTLAAAYVVSQFDVECVMVMPAFNHPFGKDLVSFEHRCMMVQLSMGRLHTDKIDVSTLEQDMEISHTIDTIRHLKNNDYNVRLVVGSDVLWEKDKWHKFDEIEKLAPPIYLGRAGCLHPEASPFLLPDVSSTAVRKMIANGENTSLVLPKCVREYIDEHGLYR